MKTSENHCPNFQRISFSIKLSPRVDITAPGEKEFSIATRDITFAFNLGNYIFHLYFFSFKAAWSFQQRTEVQSNFG